MRTKRKTTYTTGTGPDSRVVLCDDPEYVGPRTVCTAVSEVWAREIARLLTERDDLPEPEDLEPKYRMIKPNELLCLGDQFLNNKGDWIEIPEDWEGGVVCLNYAPFRRPLEYPECDYCFFCDGSGEGVVDGTRCSHCHGTGHEPKGKQPDPEPF